LKLSLRERLSHQMF